MTNTEPEVIADIKQAHEEMCRYFEDYKGQATPHESHEHRGKLIKIVETKEQQIVELKADKRGLEIALDIEVTETEKLRQKIAEQANEIVGKQQTAKR